MCLESFREQFDKHVAEHGAIVCELCGKGFKNATVLKSHVIPVHFGIKEWKCKICEKDFVKMENLEIHLAVNHLKLCSNEKSYKANRPQLKAAVQEFKQRLSVEVISLTTALVAHPDGTTQEIRINAAHQTKEDKETLDAVKSISTEDG